MPDRPNAVVFGSHEDDIHMTDGLNAITNQLSIGYLELTDDLSQRLTVCLVDCLVVCLSVCLPVCLSVCRYLSQIDKIN